MAQRGKGDAWQEGSEPPAWRNRRAGGRLRPPRARRPACPITTPHQIADPFRWFQDWMAEAATQRAERAERDDRGDRDAAGVPVGADRAAEGLDADGRRAASSSTPTSRAARAANCADNPPARCCSTGRRWQRQVRIEGRVRPSRTPRRTPISPPARASRGWAPGRPSQSRPLSGRASWNARLAEIEATISRAKTSRARPTGRATAWCPERIEFWQDMPFRLHDRSIFTRERRRLGGRASCSLDVTIPAEQAADRRAAARAWPAPRRSRRISPRCSSAPTQSGSCEGGAPAVPRFLRPSERRRHFAVRELELNAPPRPGCIATWSR